MKQLFIIGNWKSHKTNAEAFLWLQSFGEKLKKEPVDTTKTIIICPSFTQLASMSEYVHTNNVSLFLGAQNISPFSDGAYTGEVYADQVKEFATYTIIGHSERREKFHETDDMLSQKVTEALKHNLTPIFCVQGQETPIPQGVTIVAYEPIDAIGTGNPDSPEHAEKVVTAIKEKNSFVEYILYGGSVTPENVSSFTHLTGIAGVLVGGASLDPEKFFTLVNNA